MRCLSKEMEAFDTLLQCSCAVVNYDQMITILDWDDTLMCTTIVRSVYTMPDTTQLDAQVVALLQTACSYGTVYIVTNATAAWVFDSASRFLPRVHQLLLYVRITVVSARDLYEPSAPGHPIRWKTWVLQSLLAQDGLRHVVSVGDSLIDRDATHAAVRGLPSIICKYVKFIDSPSLDQLIHQLMLLNQWFIHMVAYGRTIDLQVAT